MNFVTLIPAGLAFLLLTAHFYRAHHLLLAVAVLTLLALTGLRRPWGIKTATTPESF